MLKNLLNGPKSDMFLLGFAAVGTVVFITTGFVISTTIELIFY